MERVTTSDGPQHAPANFRDLPEQVVVRDGDGLFATWHGSGVESDLPCGACGNERDNLLIYRNWGTSYPNGNSWDDREIVCGRCKWFTTVYTFREG